MYDTLLSLPLFQGMSRADLSEIIANMPLEFAKRGVGEYVVREAELCDRLIFLLDGEVRVSEWSAGHGYMVSQTLSAPSLLQMDHLFGLYHHFTRDYVCLKPCQFLFMSKSVILGILNSYMVFRLNFLNMLSTLAHRYERALWRDEPESLAQRLCRFISGRALVANGAMDVKVLMRTLARELGASRIDVSHALHELQDLGLLRLKRGGFHVEAVEKIMSFV